ncbi:MAG TPA: hypothetical protein VI306_10425 [Pyrinomonadaceae bacterium]
MCPRRDSGVATRRESDHNAFQPLKWLAKFKHRYAIPPYDLPTARFRLPPNFNPLLRNTNDSQ